MAYEQRARPQLHFGAAHVALALLGSAACSADAGPAELGEQSYALDGMVRKEERGACPSLPLDEFAGDSIRFVPAARVTPAFRPRLELLEAVVREVALRNYGRAPSEILVASSYDCRSVSGSARRLSEHALGNAIDISGFRFAPLGAYWGPDEPGFEVRIDRHWKANGSALERRHARFLEELTHALIERDVFRTLLGPAHPNHRDHFHFDMAPGHFVHL